MRVSLSLLPKLIVVLALSLALAGTGFAHRGLTTNAANEAYLAFVAAGGTAQDLCQEHAGQDTAPGHSNHGTVGGCEACRLVDTALVLATGQTVTPWLVPRIVHLAPGTSEARTLAIAHRLAQGRAPPPA